ncbi:hypothetical protein F5Y10DRAFT_229609 [Nemania abortiva]|nr:hypothetical protein F5Y10DRAFT_229609 [Nemania abortiva]
MGSPLPYGASVIGGTSTPTLSPSDRAPPPDGLPDLSPSPLSYRSIGQPQNPLFSSQTALSASRDIFSGVNGSSPHSARILRGKHLRRLSELENEAYPLKLVRELARISDEPLFLGKGKPVFGVIHVNNSVGKNLTVENIGTYTTAKAANDRALDFWDQKYGTGTLTGSPVSGEANTRFMKFEHIEEPDGYPPQVPPRQKLSYPSRSGVLEDNSHWVITDNCLSLNHKSDKGEKKVYVVISHIRDQGIHD